MEDHGFEKMLRKFKKKFETDGTLKKLRDREYYKAPSLKKRLKRKEAEKRRRIAEAKAARYKSKFGD